MGHSTHQEQGQKTIRKRRNRARPTNAHVNIIGQERHRNRQKAKETAEDNNTHILHSSGIEFLNFLVNTFMNITISPSTLLPNNSAHAT